MLKVGLTGGIGSGKTAVSDLFEKLGAPIIDTDILARRLVDDDPGVLAEISETFGEDVLAADGGLDRKKLASIVFNDNKQKKKLENILHPRIRSEVLRQVKALSDTESPANYVIIVVPLLFETGFDDIADLTLAVIADEPIRIKRIQHRDSRSLDEIQAIIDSQTNDKTRILMSDEIIENNNDFKQLEQKVVLLDKKFSQLSD
jgi:dephospho-CoA kinase